MLSKAQVISIFGNGIISTDVCNYAQQILGDDFARIKEDYFEKGYIESILDGFNIENKGKVEVVLTNSIESRTDVFICSEEIYVILIPIGLLVRSKLLLNYCLDYWNKQDIQVTHSVLDYSEDLIYCERKNGYFDEEVGN